MSFINIPNRTTNDPNASADINQIQENLNILKGGVSTDAPVSDISTLFSMLTIASSVEAIAGVNNVKLMTPLRVKEAFPASLANNGYQKLPSGLIIQWGTMSGTGVHSTSYSSTFPLAFPTSCLSISATVQQGTDTSTTVVYLPITVLSRTGFTVQYGAVNGGSYTYSYRWIAIGY